MDYSYSWQSPSPSKKSPNNLLCVRDAMLNVLYHNEAIYQKEQLTVK